MVASKEVHDLPYFANLRFDFSRFLELFKFINGYRVSLAVYQDLKQSVYGDASKAFLFCGHCDWSY